MDTLDTPVVQGAKEVKKVQVYKATWMCLAISGWMLAVVATVGYYNEVDKVETQARSFRNQARFVSDADLTRFCPRFETRLGDARP